MNDVYEKLSKMLSYNPDTGEFIWNEREITRNSDYGWNAKFANKRAGSLRKNTGYVMIGLRDGRSYNIYVPAHRLAWFMAYGDKPSGVIDHIDGFKENNRITNLRDTTRKENARNRWIDSRNSSGFNGVFWSEERQKWRVQACADCKKIHGGYFESIEDAAIAAKELFDKLGYSGRHGEKRSKN